MKLSLVRLAIAVLTVSMLPGCYTAIRGPDGGVIAAGAGPRRSGVVVDPPGPAVVAVGNTAPRRRAYVDRGPTVVVLPRNVPVVTYRGRRAYFYRGDYYRRVNGGYVIIR